MGRSEMKLEEERALMTLKACEFSNFVPLPAVRESGGAAIGEEYPGEALSLGGRLLVT